MMGKLKAIVLAAGKGTRLHTEDSDVPKVMRLACGKPLLWYVLDALSFIEKSDVIIVVGYRKHEILSRFSGYAFAEQTEQLGTGHAVMAAQAGLLGFDGDVLVCYGDMPAIKRETYESFLRAHIEQGNDCTILSGESSIPLPYGRILRDANGAFLHVVEERDCTPDQRAITELNSGVYLFRAHWLLSSLKELKNDNAQGEYYITDAPAIMRSSGAKVGAWRRCLGEEIIGVNTLDQLAHVEAVLHNN